MERKSKRMMVVLLFLLVMFAATFQECFSDSSQPPGKRRSTQSTLARRFGSTAVFPLAGNVFPLGYYSVFLKIGNPPKIYDLDIDTGSDLTWVQCDAPCKGCTKPRDSLYKPNNNLILCKDTLCSAVPSPANVPCESPNGQCDYEVEYADKGSSLGVLVADYFPMRFTNGSVLGPRLAFGCGYDINNPGPNSPPPTAGVLGLGNGKASIISQLNALGLTRNVLGHCLSGQGGGFLFMGDDLVPSSGIVWTPMSHNSLEKYYSSGPAELLYDRKTTGLKGLQVIFDSGSSYTYFNSQAYKATLDMLKKDLKGKPLKETRDDQTLPVCWKDPKPPKPVKTVRDVKDYFKPLQLSFTKNVKLELSPEAYLIVTKHGSVCLGILNGTEVGLKDFNILGDIFMLDKMVIYDNEKQQIGWIPSNCNRLPNMDRDYSEGIWRSYVADFSILEENYSTASKNNAHADRKSEL